VQSFDDALLAGMDRLEKYGGGAQIGGRLAAVRGIFPTLNVDMIFNLPGQTLALLERDLDVLERLDLDQVSFYPLMTAPGARHKMEKSMGRSDESLRHAMYERILAGCCRATAGFGLVLLAGPGHVRRVHHRPGRLRRGRQRGLQLRRRADVLHDVFARALLPARGRGMSGITQHRTLGAAERMRYDYLVRLFGGELRRDYVERRYGRSFWLRLAPELASMRLIGATRHDGDAIRLTHRGCTAGC